MSVSTLNSGYNCGSNGSSWCAPITVVIVKVHVDAVMAIVLFCESAQQFRALMMILQ